MTKYREILRLKSLDFSERNIAQSVPCSRNTVTKVLKKADEIGISYQLSEEQTDSVLEKILFSKENAGEHKRKPDYDYIHKELLKNGVSKKLLWAEYIEDCRQNGEEPLMYSQFCYYIQQDEQKRRATMHINHKPGEQIEVDWAGDPAHIIDQDTGEVIEAYVFVGVMTYSQYVFAEAFINEKQRAWITAHAHMYEFFGGVT
jgi:transposase